MDDLRQGLMLILMLLSVGDAISTWAALRCNPSAIEGNPIMRRLFDRCGLVPSLILITAVKILLAWGMARLSPPIVEILCVVLALAVWDNTRLAMRGRR